MMTTHSNIYFTTRDLTGKTREIPHPQNPMQAAGMGYLLQWLAYKLPEFYGREEIIGLRIEPVLSLSSESDRQ